MNVDEAEESPVTAPCVLYELLHINFHCSLNVRHLKSKTSFLSSLLLVIPFLSSCVTA
jgi:hypothetical protein